MTIKTYKANTNVSINVVLPSKKNLHISFVPLSDGSSVFKTDIPEIQSAIESHYNFGRLFRLVGADNVVKASATKPAKDAAPAPKKEEQKETKTETATEPVEEVAEETAATDETAEAVEEEETKEEETTSEEETAPEEAAEESGLRQVAVTDINAAKDYLADTFGISRTSMRSTKSILEKAAENGIQFVGL